MQIFIYLMIFVIGTVLGSFYNVLGYRLPKGKSIVFPSSHCPNCKHKLKFLDLFPILSYVFLKGKCRYCKKKISIIYPVMELITGILFAVSYYCFGPTIEFLISIVFVSVCIICTISDIRYMIIMDEVLIGGGLLIILLTFFNKGLVMTFNLIIHGVLSFVLIYIIKVVADKYFKKEAMGGGDVKLMFVIGSLTTFPMSFMTLCIASFIAFPYAIYTYFSKKENILPLGPFLCIAGLIIYFLGLDFNDIMMLMAD